MLSLPIWFISAAVSLSQELLPGEFAGIDLGRILVEPARLPTIKELRELAKQPEIRPALLLKLYGDGDNHHLPVWSADGERLAFQRGNVQERASKLLIFDSLGQASPRPLTEDAAYDYQFRFGVNSRASFVFARIESGKPGMRLMFSADGQSVSAISPEGERRQLPSLYERKEGDWLLAYECDGQVLHETMSKDGGIPDPLPVAKGTAPRWSRDGSRLLLVRDKGAAGHETLVRNLKTAEDRPLFAAAALRSPSWSPDERRAAFYVKAPGDNKPWRLQVCSAAGPAASRTFGTDVVVNPDFDSEGPAWEPSGRRVWCFSQRNRRQAHCPLVAVNVESGAEIEIDYCNRVTTPGDLALNPASYVPEAAFVAHDGLPQDLYVLFLSHY